VQQAKRGLLSAECEIEKDLADEPVADLAGYGELDIFNEAFKALLGGDLVEALAKLPVGAASPRNLAVENFPQLSDRAG
jgi:hypothetical protein